MKFQASAREGGADPVRALAERLPRPLRFIAVGGIGLVTDLCIFTLIVAHLPHPLAVRLISLAVATLVTWRLNRALTFARSRAEQLNVPQGFLETHDIHIHVPAGAIPKDGPSAGVTMATALISAMTSRPVRRQVSMTGEITLRGRVLPVGAIKDKVLAAHRASIKTVVIPKDNESDLEEVPADVRQDLNIVLAEFVDDVLNTALHPETVEEKSRLAPVS